MVRDTGAVVAKFKAHIGAGNTAVAGLGSIYAQLSPSRTYEGDNYVLSQQIGNAVIKHWQRQAVPFRVVRRCH